MSEEKKIEVEIVPDDEDGEDKVEDIDNPEDEEEEPEDDGEEDAETVVEYNGKMQTNWLWITLLIFGIVIIVIGFVWYMNNNKNMGSCDGCNSDCTNYNETLCAIMRNISVNVSNMNITDINIQVNSPRETTISKQESMNLTY